MKKFLVDCRNCKHNFTIVSKGQPITTTCPKCKTSIWLRTENTGK